MHEVSNVGYNLRLIEEKKNRSSHLKKKSYNERKIQPARNTHVSRGYHQPHHQHQALTFPPVISQGSIARMSAEKVIMERKDGSVRISKQQDGRASKSLHVSRSAVVGFLRDRCPGCMVVQLSVVA